MELADKANARHAEAKSLHRDLILLVDGELKKGKRVVGLKKVQRILLAHAEEYLSA